MKLGSRPGHVLHACRHMQENDDVAVTWEAMLAAMGTSFIRIGDALQGAGEAVGRFFGSIGHAVHSKL